MSQHIMLSHVVVRVGWDDEAGVWFISDTTLPGLTLEADTFDALRRMMLVALRELHRDQLNRPDQFEVDLIAHVSDRFRISSDTDNAR